MTKTLGSITYSSNSLRIKASPSGPTFPRVPLYTLGGDKLRISDNDYELPLDLYKTLSSTGCSGKTMKNGNDMLMMNNFISDLGYTGVGDRDSKRKKITKELPKRAEYIHNRIFDELDLECQGVKIIIPSNIIDIYIRLVVLLGLKFSGHTNTITEASNLIDELCKRGEIQNEQQYRNALDKFSTL